MAQAIYVGTCGWSYPTGEGTWQGYFYPSGRLNELEYYSQFFNAVEVNSSFYRPPDVRTVRGWLERVPADFLFCVKLWQKFTHPGMYREATGEDAIISARDVEIFRRALEPLVEAGRLGVLLAQFPPGFRSGAGSRQVLEALVRHFGSYRLAVELRHRSFSDDPSTAQFLRSHGITWVGIDEPKFAGSVAEDIPLTADIAYFRFHGRNAAEWWSGDRERRYRYLYSPDEIAALAARVKQTASQAKLVFAFFNNHWQAYAVRNAVDLKRALQLPLREVPVNLELMGFKAGETGKVQHA
ncbi:MAG: DUF72 domain-containing protein [Dehalococcoidales bacterium]|nr:DUF72 domain-containing protein [Dehalococcoidales bacterium]